MTRLLASSLEQIRRRYHPLHRLRTVRPVPWLRARIDRPWPTRIDGVPHPVTVRLGRNLGTVLSLGRAEERELRDLLVCLARINKCQTFWDVGANYGLFTFSLRASLPALRIEAFEPDPDYVGVLNETLGRIPPDHVRIHPVALSGNAGRVMFKRDLVTGSTGFVVGRRGPTSQSDLPSEPGLIDVVASTIDAASAQLGVPDIIKIDVEGGELDVLRGGERTLRMHMPILLIESTQSHDEIRRLLERLGYEIRDAASPSIRSTGSGMPFMALGLDPMRHQICAAPGGD